MNRIFTGILLLLLSLHLRAIPFFPCDSVQVFTVNVNQNTQKLELLMWNQSHMGFNGPQMSGVLNANPYLTLSTQPAVNSYLNPVTTNNGQTGFAIFISAFTPASIVPTGTVFTGTVTLYNPNDLSVSCDYNISFTYGTGPVGIASLVFPEALQAHPNPATEVITLGENETQPHQWKIFDSYGKLVLTSTESRIDISGLPSGIYIFRDEERVGKFMKL